MSNKITTPAGYEYNEPQITGQPDVNIHLSYAEAFDVVLDGIINEASLEPLTESTFKALAENLLGLLVDASNGEEPDFEDVTP